MLVIHRKELESVVTSYGLTVKVLAIKRGKVKLGFTAPPEVEIWREELLKTGQETKSLPK